MRRFFQSFFACLLALAVFCFVLVLFLVGFFATITASEGAKIPAKSILVVDLSKSFQDRRQDNPLLAITGDQEDETPSLYELIRLIGAAKKDSAILGIYVVANGNSNGFAASNELREALSDFRRSGKFVLAYGDYMTQKAYMVANVATRLYLNPVGNLDWRGFSVETAFFKNMLKKLEVEPQIFYDGRFKSATEPFREEKMTNENRLQTTAWLGELYQRFLEQTATARKVDTANLRKYANEYLVETAEDAVKLNLVDGTRYDDQVRDELRKKMGLGKDEKISFVTPGTYLQSGALKPSTAKDKIAIVYAEGEIVYGKGDETQVGSDEYKSLLRKLRSNKDVKAIVMRINSPGGSSIASEIIWRELEMAVKDGKPVVVSMGDVAASGGYYLAAAADSIFADPSTITGSIGVFAIIPNLESFFRNKLGITFDRVKTGPFADALTVTRALNPREKQIIQKEVDRIYADFKDRVARGRSMDTTRVETMAQGRVWTGSMGKKLGLVDQVGGLERAIESAARIAKLDNYATRSYPEPLSPFHKILNVFGKEYSASLLKAELGDEEYKMLSEIRRIRERMGKVQAMLPFVFDIR